MAGTYEIGQTGGAFIGAANREDLLDVITIISPTDTPLFTVSLPEDNLAGVEPGVAHLTGAAYSFIIAPPPPGEYEVAVSAIYAGDPYPNRLTVIVEAPQVIEPPTT